LGGVSDSRLSCLFALIKDNIEELVASLPQRPCGVMVADLFGEVIQLLKVDAFLEVLPGFG